MLYMLYSVVLCTVLEDSWTVLEDSVLYLRTVHCTYCTLTIDWLINDTNEFWITIKELKSKLGKDSRARPINRDPEQQVPT